MSSLFPEYSTCHSGSFTRDHLWWGGALSIPTYVSAVSIFSVSWNPFPGSWRKCWEYVEFRYFLIFFVCLFFVSSGHAILQPPPLISPLPPFVCCLCIIALLVPRGLYMARRPCLFCPLKQSLRETSLSRIISLLFLLLLRKILVRCSWNTLSICVWHTRRLKWPSDIAPFIRSYAAHFTI